MQHSLWMSNALVTTTDAIGMIDGVALGKANGKDWALTIDGRHSSPAAVAAGPLAARQALQPDPREAEESGRG